jgi:hypothetical protein
MAMNLFSSLLGGGAGASALLLGPRLMVDYGPFVPVHPSEIEDREHERQKCKEYKTHPRREHEF